MPAKPLGSKRRPSPLRQLQPDAWFSNKERAIRYLKVSEQEGVLAKSDILKHISITELEKLVKPAAVILYEDPDSNNNNLLAYYNQHGVTLEQSKQDNDRISEIKNFALKIRRHRDKTLKTPLY